MKKALTLEEIACLSPQQLVNKLWDKRIRNEVIRTLLGGLTASELQSIRPSETACDALCVGLRHSSPRVRWWCLQLIDHVGNASLLQQAAPLLNDPVPRVRKMALHALTCERCKADATVLTAGRRALTDHLGTT